MKRSKASSTGRSKSKRIKSRDATAVVWEDKQGVEDSPQQLNNQMNEVSSKNATVVLQNSVKAANASSVSNLNGPRFWDSKTRNSTVRSNASSGSVVMNSGSVVYATTEGESKGFDVAGMNFDGNAFENFGSNPITERAFSVSSKEYSQFEDWKSGHPVIPLQLPDFNEQTWVNINTRNPSDKPFDTFLDVWLPRHFQINNDKYMLLSIFPGSHNRPYYAGTMGVVVAYQIMDGDRVVIVKTSPVKNKRDAELEQEAFQIKDFLSHSGHMEGTCGERFIHMTASSVVDLQTKPVISRQAFIVMERMDMTLSQLSSNEPTLFQDLGALRFIFHALAKGLSCMHHAKPKAIAHGDLKPANILCSPYTDHWLDMLLQHKNPQKEKKFIYIKMADFDASFTKVWDLRNPPTDLGTPGFMSPQRITGLNINTVLPNSLEDDVWAFGMTMLSLCADKDAALPFTEFMMLRLQGTLFINTELSERLQKYIDQRLKELFKGKWARDMHVHDHTNVPRRRQIQEFLDLIQRCLQVIPSDRLTMEQVSDHSFFTSVHEKYE
jgi:serine/threonine protein kinase